MPRHGHVAIVYRTYGYEYCAKFTEIDECDDLNRKNQTCPKCHATDENNLAKMELVERMKNKPGSYWLGPEDILCPPHCCPIFEEEITRSECKLVMG